MKRISIGIAGLLLAFQALAADVRVALPGGGGALVLPVPTGWKQARPSGPVPTISLTPESGNSFQVLVSPLVRPDGVRAPSDPDSLKRVVSGAAQDALSQAVEKTLPVQELQGGNARGSYFSATDRAPKPGEFKYMTQGAASIQGLPVTFTVLSNGDTKAAIEATLQMLKAARVEQP
jgi:hypothetical protein